MRLGIDTEFLKALDPSLRSEELETRIVELYKHVHEALRQWIG